MFYKRICSPSFDCSSILRYFEFLWNVRLNNCFFDHLSIAVIFPWFPGLYTMVQYDTIFRYCAVFRSGHLSFFTASCLIICIFMFIFNWPFYRWYCRESITFSLFSLDLTILKTLKRKFSYNFKKHPNMNEVLIL